MLLAQICPRYFPFNGGIETHVREISERLQNKGVNIEVLTTDPSGELPEKDIINGVKVRRFKSFAPSDNYHFSLQLMKYLVKNSKNYDVLHAHSYHDFPALYVAQTKNKRKFVFTPHYHGGGHAFFRDILHFPYRILGGQIFNEADNIICVSSYERNLILNHFPNISKKITIIPNGINLQEFKLERGKRKRGKLLYVGRLEEYKGIQYLIKVLPELDTKFFLQIIGKGPYKKNLTQLVNELHLIDRVNFLEDLTREDLLKEYSNSEVFILLSKYEAYSICVAEALASSTPCIVANNSALKEWVDNKNCFGIDYPIIPNTLAKLIIEVSKKNIQNMRELPDWDKTVEKLCTIYSV